MPYEVDKKDHHQMARYKEKNSSHLQNYLKQEQAYKKRIIFKNEDFIALIPF